MKNKILAISSLLLSILVLPIFAEEKTHKDDILIKDEVDDTDIYTIQLGEDEADEDQEMEQMEAEEKEYQLKHQDQPKK